MQRGVLQALNPLSNRVTFIAIVPGAYPLKAKCGKKKLIHCWKSITRHRFSEMVKDSWIYAARRL